MSTETNSNTFEFNGNTFAYILATQKERKGKGGKVTPAIQYPFIDLTGDDTAGLFLNGLLAKANTLKTDGAKTLFHSLFGKLFKTSYEEVAEDNGDWDWDKLIEELAKTGHQTIDLEAIQKDVNEELSILLPLLPGLYPDEAELAAKAAAREAAGISEDEFARRYVAVLKKQNDLLKLQADAEERSAARVAKMRAAKEAKKAAAATVPAQPAN